MAKLYEPAGYKALSASEKQACCNGCGSKGLGGWLVPDSIWGLNITDCCNIHDYMYSQGTTLEDKEFADKVFLNNLVKKIEDNNKWFRFLRKRRALKMYWAVNTFGDSAFWDNKL